ncbi:hypothetical protein [Streptomyces sp. NBC_00236]|uniref:hypothetical protein n=1 Tax=Streptomyces sp. NBC_00236 TaxID=2903639 RepID=UPI002E29F687|nr:hypothetical protein [Streptomyces sp. NBC_00236]
MAVTLAMCWIAVCDVCGGSAAEEGGVPHLDSPIEAIGYVTAWGDDTVGWTLTPDGRLVCDAVFDREHEAVHEAAGKRIPEPGRDAMCATFTPA